MFERLKTHSAKVRRVQLIKAIQENWKLTYCSEDQLLTVMSRMERPLGTDLQKKLNKLPEQIAVF